MSEILEILLKIQVSEKFGHNLVMFSKQYFYEAYSQSKYCFAVKKSNKV